MLTRLKIIFFLLLISASAALASSHREAPFITRHPKVDAADFYMFRDYGSGTNDKDFVVLIADYVPIQATYGGPNYFSMDPDALYEIHVDNNGDAKEDITFQFRFKNTLKDDQLNIGGKMISSPLMNLGPIAAGSTAAINITESYGVKIVRGNRRTGTVADITNAAGGSTVFTKPVDNIGNKSIPNYAAYAASHIYGINIPGCATQGGLFVGQRKDPFVVNLGEAFDLINWTDPLGPVNAEVDSLADDNVTTLALHVPIACLTNGTEPVIGAWTTASLRQGRLLNPKATFATPSKEGGHWTQVSRLGSPLVNELVIGVKDKDRFNASKPTGDSQFADYVTNPTFPAIIELLFPGAPAPTLFPRTDLVAVFLTGVSGVNQPANVVASEMLRLNTAIAPTAIASQNNLGVIAGDNAGYPNGRRPGDDVVDIALRVVMGKLITLGLFGTPSQAPAGGAALTDGALVNVSMFDTTFPFLKTPIPGSPSN
ncbi:MAG: DUF4331 domain-containing protein [Nitrospirae bacterium]|nr:DUF4331 domain-containing protein [Candidatus Troglogloeales bacterium]